MKPVVRKRQRRIGRPLPPIHEIGAQTEAALRTIRTVLSVMAVLLLVSLRPESTQTSTGLIALKIGTILAVGIGLNWWNAQAFRGSKVVSHLADTMAVAGLVVILDVPLAHQGWVLMIIPMVSATVLFGAIATFLTWIISSAFVVTVVLTGVVGGFEDNGALIRVPGLLLAVAISVSVLARWMREGWELQNVLTDSIARREHRLATIENATRSLHRLGQDEALEQCAASVLELGFDAATIYKGLTVELAVGESDLIADRSKELDIDGPTVTAWMQDRDEKVFSVAVPEPQSGRVIVGWSTTVPTQEHAEALATLIAHTSTAIETSALLDDLRFASRHDELTGLLNRRGFEHAVEAAGLTSGLAVAFVDLDELKGINDEFGHGSGDDAIREVARRLRGAAGADAVIARFGGDEFVVAIPGGTLDDISFVAIEVHEAGRTPIKLGNEQRRVRVSIGIAAESESADLLDLLGRADEAVYEAKALGKGVVVAQDADNSFRNLAQD